MVILLAALVGAGLTAIPRFFHSSGISQSENQLSDWLFLWRQRLYPDAVKVDPRLLLIGLDEESRQLLDKPDVFWDQDLAAVTQALLDGGAQVVGIDIINNPRMGHAPKVVQDMVESWQNDMLDCLTSDRVVLIELLNDGKVLSWPERLVKNAGGGRNSCLANLQSDRDGVVRSVPFVSKTGDGATHAASFSARLAELGTEREITSVGEGKWSFLDRPVVLEGDFLRVNYPGPAGTVPKISLATLLRRVSAHDPLAEFKGKVAIILPDYTTDRHATPTMLQDDQQMLGAEIHLAVVNTLLNASYLQRAPNWAWCLTGALLSGLICLFFAQFRIALATFAGLLGLLCYYWACVYLFARHGLIMPLLTPALGGFLSASLGLFARYWTSDRARSRAQRILSRMVSPQVASVVLLGEDLPQMGGRRQQLTVLFSDINQFTPTCEKLQPEQVIEMLNEYFAEMVAIIHSYGGYVKQFVGDEIMAIFGAPQACPDHPRKAVECALAMLDRLAELKEKAGDRPGFYSVKIGVNTGYAVVGQVGSLERSEYAAVGDDVNLAARLESLTTSLGVSNLVSPTTKAACGADFKSWSWKSVGAQKFKGKSVEMEVWTLQKDAWNET